jgi:geranylgeranyl pyrophosphate synthase
MGLTAYKSRIDAELELRLGEWFRGLPPEHRDALRSILAGGKRLRGSLACLVAEALGAKLEQALPGALAVEIVQAASLVHDDLVDGDTVRRGRPAAWTMLSPRRAVLLADLLFATAIERMAELGGRECAAIAHAIASMAQGACHETLDREALQRAGREAYRHIIHLKSGSLFAAAARLGALAAAAAASTLDAATQFGARTGAVYQIADDLADEPQAPELRQLMEEEMVLLAEQAQSVLAAFPDNQYTAMLAELPATFAPRRSLTRMR